MIWHNFPSYLKSLYVYRFSEQINKYFFSEQLENSMEKVHFQRSIPSHFLLLVKLGLSPIPLK